MYSKVIQGYILSFLPFSIIGYYKILNIVSCAIQYGEGNGTPLQYSCLENPMMEEPGRLQSMGSLEVAHDWVTSLSLFTFMHWRRKWQPTPVCLPGESQGWGGLHRSMGLHRVGHNWSDLAAAAASCVWQRFLGRDVVIFSVHRVKEAHETYLSCSQCCNHLVRVIYQLSSL